MLNDYQIMVVRRAVAAAMDKDAEIKRIAKGMQVKESEVRLVLEEKPQGELVTSVNPETAGRLVWTTKQLEQLHELRAEGKGPAEIARMMGLKAHQVQSRLHSEKKSRATAKLSASTETEPAPAGDDSPAAPPEIPLESEPTACELEPRYELEEPSVISKDNPDPFSFTATVMAKRPFLFAVELTGLMRNLEYSYPPVEIGYLEANQSEGWATCHFKAAGEDYIISLRREESKS